MLGDCTSDGLDHFLLLPSLAATLSSNSVELCCSVAVTGLPTVSDTGGKFFLAGLRGQSDHGW